jgi:mono/diheme cytochrome c family protein
MSARARVVLLAALSALASLAACSTDETLRVPDPHLNRMLEQPKVRPFDEDPRAPGATGMRAPPPFTVARANDGRPFDEARELGTVNGVYVAASPLEVTRALVVRGRASFDVVCATCHGVLGDGVSVVAQRMQLTRPPTLHEPRIRAFPPGKVFATITQGYGLMPSFAPELTPDERWAVVAYLEALQLSRNANVAALPDPIRNDVAAKLAEGTR